MRLAFAASSLAALTVAAVAAAEPTAARPCTFANGLQHGPSSIRTTAGQVLSLNVENTKGRADCRFRAVLSLSLLDNTSRTLLAVRGNPGPLRRVDQVVPRGAVMRVSWLWRNWCGRPGRAVNDLTRGATVITQRWVSVGPTPACVARGTPSTLRQYGTSVVR